MPQSNESTPSSISLELDSQAVEVVQPEPQVADMDVHLNFAYSQIVQILWLVMMEHTRKYLLPVYDFNGHYFLPDIARISTNLRLLMNAYFSITGDEGAVVPVTARAEGLENYTGFINGERAVRLIYDCDARDALGFELWRDSRPEHAIPHADDIYRLILQSRRDPDATFDILNLQLIELTLFSHKMNSLDFDDYCHRHHVQLLFQSAFLHPFARPGDID